MLRLQDLLRSLHRLDVSAHEREFTVFQNLPLELRNHVWDFAAMGSRDIFVYIVDDRCDKNDELQQPAILFTCHEARAQALQHYQLVEETSAFDTYDRMFSRSIYVNFSVDRFIFYEVFERIDWWDQLNFSKRDTAKMQNCVITICSTHTRAPRIFTLQSNFRRLFNIDSLSHLTVRTDRWRFPDIFVESRLLKCDSLLTDEQFLFPTMNLSKQTICKKGFIRPVTEFWSYVRGEVHIAPFVLGEESEEEIEELDHLPDDEEGENEYEEDEDEEDQEGELDTN